MMEKEDDLKYWMLVAFTQHSNTPVLQYGYSTTPILQYSNTTTTGYNHDNKYYSD